MTRARPRCRDGAARAVLCSLWRADDQGQVGRPRRQLDGAGVAAVGELPTLHWRAERRQPLAAATATGERAHTPLILQRGLIQRPATTLCRPAVGTCSRTTSCQSASTRCWSSSTSASVWPTKVRSLRLRWPRSMLPWRERDGTSRWSMPEPAHRRVNREGNGVALADAKIDARSLWVASGSPYWVTAKRQQRRIAGRA